MDTMKVKHLNHSQKEIWLKAFYIHFERLYAHSNNIKTSPYHKQDISIIMTKIIISP